MPQTQISCPQCRQMIAANIEQLFDVTQDPQAKQRLLGGVSNMARCPHCGFQGRLATPVVYHDNEKELLLTFFPPDLNVPLNDHERTFGPLIKKVTESLPPEKRKGYLLKPIPNLSFESMIKLILEKDARSAPFLSPVYAALEGVFLAALSYFITTRTMKDADPRLIFQAVGITFAIAGGLAVAFSAGLVRVGGTAARVVVVAMSGLCLYVLALVLCNGVFGMGLPNLQFLGCSLYGYQGKFIAEAGETYYFQVGTQSQPGPVQFNLTEVISITGRVTDAVSGTPLPGNMEPYATADLYRSCGDGCFESIASQQVDGNGRFSFEESNLGGPLTNGSYFITVVAQLYQSRQFGPFDFQGSSLDVGDLPLSPPAVIRGRGCGLSNR